MHIFAMSMLALYTQHSQKYCGTPSSKLGTDEISCQCLFDTWMSSFNDIFRQRIICLVSGLEHVLCIFSHTIYLLFEEVFAQFLNENSCLLDHLHFSTQTQIQLSILECDIVTWKKLNCNPVEGESFWEILTLIRSTNQFANIQHFR